MTVSQAWRDQDVRRGEGAKRRSRIQRLIAESESREFQQAQRRQVELRREFYDRQAQGQSQGQATT